MFPESIDSERLIFKRLCKNTLPVTELYKIVNENADNIEELTKFLHWEPHQNLKETEEFIESVNEEWENRETITYAIFTEDEFIGLTSLSIKWPNKTGQMGLWLRKSAWGNGYSSERASVIFELAFEKLDLEFITVNHAVENTKSRKAIEKYISEFNGQKDGILRNEIVTNEVKYDASIYSVSREQYFDSL